MGSTLQNRLLAEGHRTPIGLPERGGQVTCAHCWRGGFFEQTVEESALISPLETAVKRWESFQRYSVATVL